jgi:ABC-type sugar transport system ATPase subunit
MSVEVKQLVDEYILICFDIPQSQGKLRKKVLKAIHDIGGQMHTASVYIMPYSDQAMAVAEEIKGLGDVVLWRSKQLDLGKAEALTMNYAEHIVSRCQVISQRFVMIKDYIEQEQFGRATLMIIKTKRLLDQLKKINETFSPPWLPVKIAEFDSLLGQVMNVGKGGDV